MRIIEKTDTDKRNKIRSIVFNSMFILLPFIVLLFVIPIIINLKKANAISFGGANGFWQDTVFTLISKILYGDHFHVLKNIFQFFVIAILLASLIIIIYKFKENKSILKNSFLIFVFTVTILSFAANYLQYELLDILFPRGRYALTYYLLFSLLIIFIFDYLSSNSNRIYKRIFLAISLFFTLNFVDAINFHFTNDWKMEADTDRKSVV